MPPKKLSISEALEIAEEAIARNDIEAARKLYISILNYRPGHRDAENALKNLEDHKRTDSQKPPVTGSKKDGIAALYLAGKGELAEKLCRKYIEQYAESDELLNLLGASLLLQHKYVEAIDTYNHALELFPQFTEGYINRANGKRSLGKLKGALADYNKAIKLDPNHVEALSNRGGLFQKLGQYAEAIEDYENALKLNNQLIDARFNLGNTLMEQGRFIEAIEHFKKAIEIDPKYSPAYSNCAYCLKQIGDFTSAIEKYTVAIKLEPNLSINYCGRGEIYCDERNYEQSIADFNKAILLDPEFARAYNGLGKALHHQGQLSEATTQLKKAIEIEPDYAIAYNNLGAVLTENREIEGALEAFNKVISQQPDLPQPYNNLGNLLRELGLFTEAIVNFDKAIQLNSSYAEAFNNRGSSLQSLGRLSEAIDSYNQAIELTEFYPMAYSNLLTTLNYSQDKELKKPIVIAQEFGLQVTRRVKKAYSDYERVGSDKKLKIGFVSGDLRSHPVGYFLEDILPIFENSKFDIVAYPTKPRFDDLSAKLKSCFSSWTPIYGMDDESAAKQIKKDNVQILIDLSGHTAGNRLPMFAYRPAPLQITWLGYFATTGVKEIDYLIGDPFMTPEEMESMFTEKIICLEQTRWCFSPPKHKITIASTPALKSGFITFGCFNNLTKINDRVLSVWSKILRAIPNSRLLLKNSQFRDEHNIAKILKRLEDFGIRNEQTEVEGPDNREAYLKSYNRVDIALDPFPFTGGATSAEALWMGVPLITLLGSSMVSRQGVSILTNAGLEDWIASSEEEYIDKAILFSSDIKKLEALRKSLRQKLLSSPLFDANKFVSNFEKSLIRVWQEHKKLIRASKP
jgi:protein O-GlcNAc transferase